MSLASGADLRQGAGMWFILIACSQNAVPLDSKGGGADSAPIPDDSGPTGDSGRSDDTGPTDDSGTPAGLVFDGGVGPYAVEVESASVAGNDVTWYVPDLEAPPAVLWSHGFFRGPSQHSTAAAYAASWGFLVATPALPSLTDHAANAEFVAGELRGAALGRGASAVGLVGHSAGGMVSVVAAAQMEAFAVVTLDGTDAFGLGEDAAGDVTDPVEILAGEPSSCNSNGNGREWELAGDTRPLQILGANHCDFESDTDALCTVVCGDPDPDRQQLIQQYTVAWLLAASGGDASGWLPGGVEAESDAEAGAIEEGF